MALHVKALTVFLNNPDQVHLFCGETSPVNFLVRNPEEMRACTEQKSGFFESLAWIKKTGIPNRGPDTCGLGYVDFVVDGREMSWWWNRYERGKERKREGKKAFLSTTVSNLTKKEKNERKKERKTDGTKDRIFKSMKKKEGTNEWERKNKDQSDYDKTKSW